MSGDCPECGGKLLWGGMNWVEHDDGFHHFKRRILLRAISRRLNEEAVYGAMAFELALRGGVLVLWRIVLPTDLGYATSEIPGELWDEQGAFRDNMLAQLGYGVRDWVQAQRGVRPSPMQVKYRVFDER